MSVNETGRKAGNFAYERSHENVRYVRETRIRRITIRPSRISTVLRPQGLDQSRVFRAN